MSSSIISPQSQQLGTLSNPLLESCSFVRFFLLDDTHCTFLTLALFLLVIFALTMIDNRCFQKCQQITAVKQYLLTKVTAWRTPMQVTSIQLTVYTAFQRQGNYNLYSLFVPKNFRSLEQKFPGAEVLNYTAIVSRNARMSERCFMKGKNQCHFSVRCWKPALLRLVCES